MSENEKTACGCVLFGGLGGGGRHTRKCLARGRDKMTAEEIEVDDAKLKAEERDEARTEFLDEATKKLDAVLPTVLGALDASKELRPKLPWKEIAAELRGLFADDLAPFGALFRDAAAVMLWESSKSRAEVIKRLFKETDLPMDICVQVVLASSADLAQAIKNINVNNDKKKT